MECNDGFLISEPCLFLNGILQVVPETQELSTTLQQHVSGNLNSVLRRILLFISETSKACIKIQCAISKLKVTEMGLPTKTTIFHGIFFCVVLFAGNSI